MPCTCRPAHGPTACDAVLPCMLYCPPPVSQLLYSQAASPATTRPRQNSSTLRRRSSPPTTRTPCRAHSTTQTETTAVSEATAASMAHDTSLLTASCHPQLSVALHTLGHERGAHYTLRPPQHAGATVRQETVAVGYSPMTGASRFSCSRALPQTPACNTSSKARVMLQTLSCTPHTRLCKARGLWVHCAGMHTPTLRTYCLPKHQVSSSSTPTCM